MLALFDQPWALFAVLLGGLFLTVEIGYHVGQRLAVSSDQLRHEQLVAARDGVGLLLSLLLGFTLAMTLSRFDQRKQLIVDEADAIGTAYLRAQILPDPARSKMLDLMRQYVDARMRFSVAPLDGQESQQASAQTKQLQTQMWQQVTELARQAPDPINALLVQALNDVIDFSEKRVAIRENRVPQPIWIMLVLISMLTCLTVGMTVRRRFWYVMAMTPLMIAIVMSLIADLNSPRAGFIQIGRESIERLQLDLSSDSNQAPPKAAPKN